MPQLVLASTSPYRAAALRRLGLTFLVQAPAVDEAAFAVQKAADLALRLAHAKADAVGREHPDAIVIGADQVGDVGGRKLGKPGTAAAAVDQLCSLSGAAAVFHTAVAVHDGRRARTQGRNVTTKLQFRTFSRSEAEHYVALDEPLDCAGAFKIEAAGIALFERIESEDPSALIGLPMIALLQLLADCGINPLQPPAAQTI